MGKQRFGGLRGAAVAMCLTVFVGAVKAVDPEPAAVDAVFSQFGDHTPGAALAVIRDEKIIYSHGYGMANLDHGIPIAANTVFDVGSTSKQFTAACVQLLAEDGKLAIADDVRKYLPELPQYERPITIAHLLHHTSGLRDYTAVMGVANLPIESDYTDEFLLKLIYRQKGLNFAPGERFSYTNTGYFLLGEIVRRVSGMPMSKFAKERIFEPLGMNSTMFWDDHTMIVPHRADSFYPRIGGYQLAISLMDNVGDGGIYTTVEDLAKWDANFYHNKLGAGKPEFLERMQEVGLLSNGKSSGYASGLFIGTRSGTKMVSHGGAWRGFRAELVRFPEKKLSVICLANLSSVNSSAMALRVADLYLGDGSGEKGAADSGGPSSAATIAMPEADWKKFEGKYRATETGSIWTVTRSGDLLSIVSSSGLTFSARPIGAFEFESTNRPQLARIYFKTDDHGKVFAITQTIADTPAVELTPIEPIADVAAGLADFEGMYDSEEIGGWMRVTQSKGQLWLTNTDDADAFAVTRYGPNGFSIAGFEVVFTRGGDGKLDGFGVNTPRASGMRYVRRAKS